jgi:hypothetical protein
MVKFQLRRRASPSAAANPYRSGNHAISEMASITWNEIHVCDISVGDGYFKFDENLCRVCPKGSAHCQEQF